MEDYKGLKRSYGKVLAERIIQRMGEIQQARSVGELRDNVKSSRPHFLKGNRKEDLSIVVKDALRIITRPNMNEKEYSESGDRNLFKITKIKIIKLEDYHG